MSDHQNVKDMVKAKYSEIALQDKADNQASCCGASCCSTEVYSIMSDDYSQMEGYNADADLGLGCGLPTQFAKIKKVTPLLILAVAQGMTALLHVMKQAKRAK